MCGGFAFLTTVSSGVVVGRGEKEAKYLKGDVDVIALV